MRRDPIVIVDHDPAWAASFEEQRALLEPALDGVLVRPLEHIGSTAVPGLPAKPIVDVLGVVADHEAALAALPRLAAIGWVHAPEPGDDERRRVSVCRPDVEHRTHHLHLVEEASDGWPDWLLFRDHLRAHPDVADAYADLKRSLAAADPDDRPGYRSAKAPFITRVLDQARADADHVNDRGHLDVGDGHRLYWEDWGAPDGVPVVFLHGGPGDSFKPSHQALFDPAVHRVLVFDQRGCGRSTPFASTEHNTTQHLAADIDRLLDHRGMGTVHVAGGSWGSTLALAYALGRPDRVRSLLLWSVYLAQESENRWTLEGMPGHQLPAEWERFISLVPEERRGSADAVLAHYAEQMRSDDEEVARRHAFEWTLWEASLLSIAYDPEALEAELRDDPSVLTTALFETHYALHGAFLPDNAILDGVHVLRDVPCRIVQGRFDLCTPAVTAWDLQRAYGPAATLEMVNSGHLRSDPALRDALVAAAATLR